MIVIIVTLKHTTQIHQDDPPKQSLLPRASTFFTRTLTLVRPLGEGVYSREGSETVLLSLFSVARLLAREGSDGLLFKVL